jgi:hypothetical protein
MVKEIQTDRIYYLELKGKTKCNLTKIKIKENFREKVCGWMLELGNKHSNMNELRLTGRS